MKVLYCARENYRKIKRNINNIILKFHLYKKVSLPDYDSSYLEKKWNCKDPKCVSDEYRFKYGNDTKYDLSIIIPLYNSSKYVKRLVQMLKEQKTEYGYEVIFINDGSTDETGKLIGELICMQDNFKCIEQKNAGISEARNKGINESRGKYISFIDHDDEIKSDFIQKLMDAAMRNNAEIIKCAYGQKYGQTTIGKGIAKGFVWGGDIFKRLVSKSTFSSRVLV